ITAAEMNAGISPSSIRRGLRAYIPRPRNRNITPLKKSRPAPPTAFTGAGTLRLDDRDDTRSATFATVSPSRHRWRTSVRFVGAPKVAVRLWTFDTESATVHSGSARLGSRGFRRGRGRDQPR